MEYKLHRVVLELSKAGMGQLDPAQDPSPLGQALHNDMCAFAIALSQALTAKGMTLREELDDATAAIVRGCLEEMPNNHDFLDDDDISVKLETLRRMIEQTRSAA